MLESSLNGNFDWKRHYNQMQRLYRCRTSYFQRRTRTMPLTRLRETVRNIRGGNINVDLDWADLMRIWNGKLKTDVERDLRNIRPPYLTIYEEKTLTTTIYETGNQICLSLLSMLISIENDITIKCKDYTEAGPPIFRDELDSCLPSDFAESSKTTGEGTSMLTLAGPIWWGFEMRN